MSALYLGVSLKLAELNAAGVIIGLTYCLYQVASSISGVIVPKYLYRHYRKLLIACPSLITLLIVVIALSKSIVPVALSFTFLGLLLSSILPVLTHILVTYKVGTRSSLLALTLPQNLGVCIGFLLCSIVGLLLPLSMVILYTSLLGLTGLASGVTLYILTRDLDLTSHHNRASYGDFKVPRSEQTSSRSEVRRLLLMFYIAVFLSFLSAGIFFPTLPVVLKRLSLTVSEIYFARFCGALAATFAYLYIVNVMCSSLVRVFMYVSYSLAARSALFLLLLPLVLLRPPRGILLACTCILLCFIGLSWSIIHTGLRATALAFGANAHEIAGYTTSMSSLGLVIGSLVSGMLIDVNMALIPVVSGVIAILSALLYVKCSRMCIGCQTWVLSSAISTVPISSPTR